MGHNMQLSIQLFVSTLTPPHDPSSFETGLPKQAWLNASPIANRRTNVAFSSPSTRDLQTFSLLVSTRSTFPTISLQWTPRLRIPSIVSLPTSSPPPNTLLRWLPRHQSMRWRRPQMPFCRPSL